LNTDRRHASSALQTVRVYDAASGHPTTTLTHGAPVLDACFAGAGAVVAGGLDGGVRHFDLASGQSTLLGAHAGGARCVQWLVSSGLVASAGWDAALRLWDPRAAASGGGAVAELSLPGKAYSMSLSADRLVVATSGRRVEVYELRALGPDAAPDQSRESPLKFQTRAVACFPDGRGFALSSVEGRVAMEYFDTSGAEPSKPYAFKSHRRSEGGRDVVFPVNAIAFNLAYGTFATGGGDGVVNLWDGEHKKRLHQITGYPTSVAAMAFNASATKLAVAASYTFEKGDVKHPADAIYVRDMAAEEVTPRQAQKRA